MNPRAVERVVARTTAAICVCAFLLAPVAAFAFREGGSTDPGRTSCFGDGRLDRCHADPTADDHGASTPATKRCRTCHDVHATAGPVALLPYASVTATCFACHDGTGGKGVYGALAARGLQPGARHRIDSTSVVPGGDGATGGPRNVTFRGPGGTLTCGDCHSVHRNDVVDDFLGERRVVNGGWVPSTKDRLLRRLPSGATTPTAQYGSDWCGGCHQGRLSRTPLHNHPVESSITTSNPYTYSRIAYLARATLAGDPEATATVVDAPFGIGQNHGAFLMPFPRADVQKGHSPVCQQCHEDSRDVGTLDVTGRIGDATAYTVTQADGAAPADNPRFQNFPHETANPYMLVETEDDLCTNCHPPTVLP